MADAEDLKSFRYLRSETHCGAVSLKRYEKKGVVPLNMRTETRWAASPRRTHRHHYRHHLAWVFSLAE
jgi:hypothetical protein